MPRNALVSFVLGIIMVMIASAVILLSKSAIQVEAGILGLLMAALLLLSSALEMRKRSPSARSGSAGKAVVTPKCPACGREISAEFVVCPFCGKPLKEGFAVPPSSDQTLRESETTGSEPATAVPPETPVQETRSRSRRRKVGIAVVATLVLIGGLVTAYVLQKSSRLPSPAFSVAREREQGLSPIVVTYQGPDGTSKTAYSIAGRITIIAREGVSSEAVTALVSKLGGSVYAEIPDAGIYFTRGFDGTETEVLTILYHNRDLVDGAFPTLPVEAKGVWAIEDFETPIAAKDGKYLNFDIDEGGNVSFFWGQDSRNVLTHGQLVSLLAGIRKGDGGAIDCAVRDESGNEIWMDTGQGLRKAAEIARKERDEGRVTIVNNSWGAPFPEVGEGASAAELKEKTEAFVTAEANAYRTLLAFLESNPNVVAVKSMGNEEVDLSRAVAEAKGEEANAWKRLVLVGAVSENLEPVRYSNRATGFTTNILWVPEAKDADGNPVPGTSFTAPEIAGLLGKIARERPDLSPDQLVAVLFDYRVSPRVNLRPTIKDPLGDETLNKALEVAAERFPPSKVTSQQESASKTSGARVQAFPATATVDLEFGTLLLKALVNGSSIGQNDTKYAVEWYLKGGALISREPWLTKEPFVKAIGGREGTYSIRLVVKDRASGALVGEGTATVTAKKSEEKIVTGPSRWVSATPGNGMKCWYKHAPNDWWQYDVDLQVRESSGTLVITCTAVSPNVPQELRTQMMGTRAQYTFSDWKDDGKTVTFSVKSEAQVLTFRLTRSADGHLTGTVHAPETTRKVSGMEVTTFELEGTLDLLPAPK